MSLATELRASSVSFAQHLSNQRRVHLQTRRQAEADELKRQMEEAPKIAAELIALLPNFLQSIAEKRNTAYVFCRDACKPWQSDYPDFESASESTLKNLSNYKVRRYLRGAVQHVARWGLNQGFTVGLTKIGSHQVQSWDIQRRCHDLPFPVFMPGMFADEVPTTDFQILFFAW